VVPDTSHDGDHTSGTHGIPETSVMWPKVWHVFHEREVKNLVGIAEVNRNP
jgi:hypothetical protein